MTKTNGNKKKDEQLGMPHGTASYRLKKSLMFSFVQKLGLDTCYRCNKKILLERELSIDHKEDWLDTKNPVELFFDIDNISFSHLTCNCAAARQPFKKDHGANAYKRGCRCELCREAHRISNMNWRRNRKKRLEE